jgi:putative hydrolase of the HAD superfamily
VTFDAGQTLLELDTAFLARRLGERGVATTGAALDRALPGAWASYEALVAAEGAAHGGPRGWKHLVGALLAGAGVAEPSPLVEWLYVEQRTRNLWRRPVAGMLELVDDLRAAGLAVGVISNSEGRLAELFAELGWSERFACVADSGRLGIDKPDPRIFAWTLARLGAPAGGVVHVGDSLAADVAGARGAGMRAIWFGGHTRATEGAIACADAAAVRGALRDLGVAV